MVIARQADLLMISSNRLRSTVGEDDSDRAKDSITPDEQHERPNEEYDEEGNVVKVENLEFIPGILGQGSFGTVRLARRRNLVSAAFCNGGSREHSGAARSKIFRNSPPRSSRRHSFDEAAEDGVNGDADRSVSSNYYGNSLINRARSFGLFRSKSHEYMGEIYANDNNPNDDELVAVKIFSKSNLKRRRTIERDKTTKRVKVKTALQQVEREIALMKKLSHPNLVRLYEVINSPETDILYMVLEYMPLGEILTFREEDGTFRRSERLRNKQIDGLVDGGHFDEEHAALYIVDILHALAYLHQHHICHRDLKPENILLSDRGIAKVGDFGVSHIFEEENSGDSSPRFLDSIDEDHSQRRLSGDVLETDKNTHMVGTSTRTKTNSSSSSSFCSSGEAEENPFFLTRHESDSAYAMGRLAGYGILTKTEGTWCFWSPEMCDGSNSGGFSGYAADMWAVGICLYIFAKGKLPFYNTLPLDLFDMIAKCDVEYSGLDLSESLVDLLKSCLEKDPNKRAGVGDCLHHPFLQNAREQRIRQLGPEFEMSRSTILHISEDDIRMAFRTVTSVPAKVLRCASKKIQEGLAHTCDNLRARIPSLAPQLTSRDTDCLDKKECDDDEKRRCGDIHRKTANKKQNNPVLFFSRQISNDSCQSEPENNQYPLKLQKNENESETETETNASRLSSGISFGSTITDDLHPKEFSSRVSFGSNNTDELPMILSEEDDTRMSTENKSFYNDVSRRGRPSLDEDSESADPKQHHESDNVDCLNKTSNKCSLSDKCNDYHLQNSKVDEILSNQSGMEMSIKGNNLDQDIESQNKSGCLIQ